MDSLLRTSVSWEPHKIFVKWVEASSRVSVLRVLRNWVSEVHTHLVNSRVGALVPYEGYLSPGVVWRRRSVSACSKQHMQGHTCGPERGVAEEVPFMWLGATDPWEMSLELSLGERASLLRETEGREAILIQNIASLIFYSRLCFPWRAQGSTPRSRGLGFGCSRHKIGKENRGE